MVPESWPVCALSFAALVPVVQLSGTRERELGERHGRLLADWLAEHENVTKSRPRAALLDFQAAKYLA